jgi:hypothetical protein
MTPGDRTLLIFDHGETDSELRRKSNRAFRRIVQGLPSGLARRYSDAPSALDLLMKLHLAAAVQQEDWEAASKLAAEIAENRKQASSSRFCEIL